ncbi:MAG: hydroxymethylglutaryl-CoA synthase [Candidatus Micrarchaeota archaeon]|nr:hydroxymethylglutaryl-CoA synthase [Candidatus Micrarchaeota archaeon]
MVGIVGYGVHIPRYRIKVEEIARIWGDDGGGIKDSLGIIEKSVPGMDEDAATFAVEASRNAVHYSGVEPKRINAIFVGSESHPYAVKPTATIVAEAIGATPHLTAVDMQFACKAGTTAIQCCMGMCSSEMIEYGLGIGTDISQGRPGDALEYSAGAGAAAFIIGRKNVIAEIEGTCSYTTDTPDFWRRPGMDFPSHGGRFTGEPAYFKHTVNASKELMEKLGLKPSDFDYAVFHQPNGKFPLQVAKILQIDVGKVKQGLMTPLIGNTYSAASLIGLASVLDVAKPGSRILLTSFGSGAGSDSFSIVVTDKILEKKGYNRTVIQFVGDKEYLDYGLYVKQKRKLKTL